MHAQCIEIDATKKIYSITNIDKPDSPCTASCMFALTVTSCRSAFNNGLLAYEKNCSILDIQTALVLDVYSLMTATCFQKGSEVKW